MKVKFVGDVHGGFKSFEKIANESDADAVIQCGDFGIWPYQDKIKLDINKPVYFCRGNHDWHDYLDTLKKQDISELTSKESYASEQTHEDRLVELRKMSVEDINKLKVSTINNFKNVYHCDSGSILELNGRRILFMGGALSIDKHRRIIGESWWPQEQMSDKEYMEIFDKVKYRKIDIIVSHTCPQFIVDQHYSSLTDNYYDYAKQMDSTQVQLAHLYYNLKFKPKLWVFGHWHTSSMFTDDHCVFVGLDRIDDYKGITHTNIVIDLENMEFPISLVRKCKSIQDETKKYKTVDSIIDSDKLDF